MKMNVLNFLFALVALHSCCPPWQDCKEPVPGPDSTRFKDLPYEIIWQTPLFRDTNYSITDFKPILFKDMVIFGRRKGRSKSVQIVSYDKKNGDRRWEWEEEVRNLNFTDNYLILNDTLVVVSGSQIYLIDMNTGNTIYEINKRINEAFVPLPAISSYNGRIYHSSERKFKDSLTYIRSVDLKTYKWRTEVIDHVDSVGDLLSVYPPSVWLTDNRDTILVSVKRVYNYENVNRRFCNLISYNITTDTVLWEKENVDHVGSITESPRIEGDRIYFIGTRDVSCFNKYTGELIWKTHVVEDGGVLLTSTPIYTRDTIFLLSTTEDVTALDKVTGRILFNNKCSGNGHYLTLYKDRLYRAFIEFDIIDAKDGEVLLNIKYTHNYSRRTAGVWSNGVTIDPETELMYVEDGFFAMCLTIPKT